MVGVKGDKVVGVWVEVMEYLYMWKGVVKGVDSEGKEFVLWEWVEEVGEELNGDDLLGGKGEFMVWGKGVCEMRVWLKGGLGMKVKVGVGEKMMMRKAKGWELKEWL